MPPRRFHFSSSRQLALAVLLGTIAGLAFSFARASSMAFFIAVEGMSALSEVFLAAARMLAVPMIIAAGIEGLVGLEATRGLGRLGRKTAVCFVAASLLTLISSWVLVGVLRLSIPLDGLLPLSWQTMSSGSTGQETAGRAGPAGGFPFFWPALVLVGLGLGFYRNQIGEGRSHLLLRFWRGVDDTASLLVDWARRLVPGGVLLIVCSSLAQTDVPLLLNGESLDLFSSVLICWLAYAVVVLPAALLLFTRINPWKYARVWAPAVLTALGTGNLPAALPLSLETARRRTGISRRVTGFVLPVGAVAGRDGAVLGWVALALVHATVSRTSPGFGQVAAVALAVWAGVGIGGTFGASGLPVFFLASTLRTYAHTGMNPPFVLALGVLITFGGAAVSLWSQACIAAIVAHWEGERDLLTPRPPDDPFFGERLSKDFL